MTTPDCMLWVGAKAGNGYGVRSVSGRQQYAHRLAWEAANGRPVPAGLVVAHRCDTPACINPQHLFVCTQAENVRVSPQPATRNEEEAMAYSDYGGYAYRNGKRVEDRSDATITPEGDTYGTPGSYPGFALLAAGVPHADVMRRIEWPSGHAVLGDGPVYLVLRKTYATLYRGAEEQELPIDRDDYDADEVRRAVELDGCKVELVYTQEDNYYVYARLTQPDGNVWHGWSGYGVGAGLEDAGYGYSTSDREDMLLQLWPESIAG